ncbi:MAG: Holliday junction branch migration protein RuvA [Legionellales bacterium]|nr:Holliday junction branch migration protein RuvA [Legionellales bacterium]
MICQLRGILLEKTPPELVLDVNGVGYEVIAPMSTFYRLPEIGQTVQLLTYLSIREDAHQLFGFYTPPERKLFRGLLKVNGVGPKLALAILSSIEPDAFVQTVLNNDLATLIRLPGIGKKTAERLVIEMRDRLSDWYDSSMSTQTNNSVPVGLQNTTNGVIQEAINALTSLGYKPQEAARAVAKTGLNGEAGCEPMIRSALKLLAIA